MNTRKPGAVAALLVSMLLLTQAAVAQDDSQGTERRRIELGRLAEGPAIVGGGLMLGEPSGLTAKLWFTETGFGADLAVAWSFADNAGVYMHANGIFHLAIVETGGGRYLIPYLGAGVFYRVGESSRVGLRVPVGLAMFPLTQLPLEFFAEIAPGIGLLPDTGPSFGAGLGVRFYLPF